jgi:hypothetical protein
MLYVSFTYKHHWCRVSQEEVFAVEDELDYACAVDTFRDRHGYDDTLMVFGSYDLVDWKVVGEVQSPA